MGAGPYEGLRVGIGPEAGGVRHGVCEDLGDHFLLAGLARCGGRWVVRVEEGCKGWREVGREIY